MNGYRICCKCWKARSAEFLRSMKVVDEDDHEAPAFLEDESGSWTPIHLCTEALSLDWIRRQHELWRRADDEFVGEESVNAVISWMKLDSPVLWGWKRRKVMQEVQRRMTGRLNAAPLPAGEERDSAIEGELEPTVALDRSA